MALVFQPKFWHGGARTLFPVLFSRAKCLAECKALRPVQSRDEAYLRTMRVGLSPWRAGLLRMRLQVERIHFWGISCVLGCFELVHLRVL